eukprot:GHVS01053987.1.p1 GENE.GHVS01053987.1~~GHVS01053987.1.p1  ORF type:complete len:286 (-),score=52.43 GHVS01053987.1:384-1241(-)
MAQRPNKSAGGWSAQRFQTSAGRQQFSDAVRGEGRRRDAEEFRRTDIFQRHQKLLASYQNIVGGDRGDDTTVRRFQGGPIKTDYDVLKDQHEFLRDDRNQGNDPSNCSGVEGWERSLACRYYERLFKEYVLCDFSRCETGQVGMRWRSEAEVVQGKGQFVCGNKACDAADRSRGGLRSYEMNFVYTEKGKRKQALVKARLCLSCARRLNFKKEDVEEEVRRKSRRRENDQMEEGGTNVEELAQIKVKEEERVGADRPDGGGGGGRTKGDTDKDTASTTAVQTVCA